MNWLPARTAAVLGALALAVAVPELAPSAPAALSSYIGTGDDPPPAGVYDCELWCSNPSCIVFACRWHETVNGYCEKSANNFSKRCIEKAGGPYASCSTQPDAGPCTNYYSDPCLKDATHPLPICGSTVLNGCGSKSKCNT